MVLGEWTTLAVALGAGEKAQSPIARVAIDSADFLQGSVLNLLTGFYRLAFAPLRAVIEGMTIGLHFQCSGAQSEFKDWTEGGEIGFGRAADHCMTHIARLEAALQGKAGDDLFGQRGKDSDGGLARRLFRTLSHYAHGQPRFRDADISGSNGPVFVPAAVRTWRELYMSTYAVALLEARLAEPSLRRLGSRSQSTAEGMFRLVVGALSDGTAKRLLDAVPTDVWTTNYGPGRS